MDWNVELSTLQAIGLLVDYSIKIFAIGFVPEGRRPSSSTAWLLAILLVPFVGLPLFLLMGSPYINRRRHRLQAQAREMIDDVQKDIPDHPSCTLPSEVESVIRLNRRLTGFPAVEGKNEGLHTDYAQIIQAIARAVDQAQDYVYIEIYIQSWDEDTEPFYRALERARQRGVKVKLLLDQIGSLKYPGYFGLGRRLSGIGVDWRLTMPLQLHKFRFRRPDLRNHRKLVVIDGKRGFLGSMNMISRRYNTSTRMWVDYMVELSGPIVTSLEVLFAVDWYLESDEVLDFEHPQPLPQFTPSANYLQLIPSGPGYKAEPNLRMYNSLIHHAKKHLVMVSPYFVPDESMLEAVTTACYRGVTVELFVSEKADQFMVGHAQSSYYQTLLEAGVKIWLFPAPFVLHSKFLLADPDGSEPMSMFGSSNMDMRSFGLNYESTLLVAEGNLIAELNQLANNYQVVCHELTLDEWSQRGPFRRYIDNVMRLTSALQ
ncbi:cardiolipin synthase [Corynebacterium phocae]|uniref:Cardiolipin synthase n=1 Tax=Corynebacterium phocae TaxID=161895 RepID=A0A1L7D589_9CORY|nr:phospholipase D-like domain-containing protein [Corynebacterium phocae]APT93309.1 cardiolipin synthase [Corynebacterium phocae]KAA8721640.1 cardiolipin synthase A [Corynebacterium phocae]